MHTHHTHMYPHTYIHEHHIHIPHTHMPHTCTHLTHTTHMYTPHTHHIYTHNTHMHTRPSYSPIISKLPSDTTHVHTHTCTYTHTHTHTHTHTLQTHHQTISFLFLIWSLVIYLLSVRAKEMQRGEWSPKCTIPSPTTSTSQRTRREHLAPSLSPHWGSLWPLSSSGGGKV